LLDIQPICALYGLGLRLKPSDEIRLYAIDMLRTCTEKGLKRELHLIKQLVFILLSYILYVLNMGSKNVALQALKFV
jgi:hypothetical protein